MATVRVIHAAEMRLPANTTPGMDRREAYADEGVWAGTVRTEPGVMTGWHVHSGHDTYIYVSAGEAHIEYGPGGKLSADAEQGDFVVVPRGVIHREGTVEGSTGVEAVLVRVGH